MSNDKKEWEMPDSTVVDEEEINKEINARSWTVGSAMDLGRLYDQGVNQYNGPLIDPENYGYVIQAEVISNIIMFGFFVYEVISSGISRFFRQSGSSWIRVQ